MHLIYLVFGTNVRNHFQANFSMLTFLREPAALDGITVVTDAPDFYRHLSGQVTILPVAEATLRDWKGEFDFFWRVKIKALETVARQHPGVPLLYLDSDTFLHGSAAELKARLTNGEAFMHEREGALSELGSKTEQRMWTQVRQQTFGGVQLHERHAMWNAGVVGIPAAKASEAIALALAVCDDFSRCQVTPRLIEQFALSVALDKTYPLHPARPFIGHYWSTKDEWNEHIAAFLLESHLQQRTVAEELAALAQFDFRLAPVKQRQKSTRWRLVRLVDRLFPPRETLYAGSEE
ncbi:hypothetical protein LJY25_15160 [Hymenobacter sp. BT175]|uniref:hypothetical protein n=1 Tax=Hymenobacter translucens TaxID=2886507 RepID=UPI001D0E272F|nr:hypothetical protein [Hymenobacter translucens]MCC2547789.1 hypothetical protein [Hymenobacter translucens]